ncbi:hypothetical protein CRE_10313 [Caenorhabditis remanei]|uniref:SCP domain-containing protein n=2 Tax=Caenorhabditis remanei TaxID=31234 RepID=E3M6F3_CAERE|nr:hypothetical protein CRE_10313 [Caenorhabditis remanei]
MNFYFRLFALVATVLSEFSETGKDFILTRHNELRSRIALGKYVTRNVTKEPATNMLKLNWNATLESSSQLFSSGCPAGHSKNRNNIGENMYWWTSPVITETDSDSLGNRSSNLWESEFQRYGWTENKLSQDVFNTGIGHASQMSWARTSSIGCGVSKCTGGSIEGTEYVVVCQYYPAGNYIGLNIYESGETCSACPNGKKCESSTGLCI